jgi:hypothetical protein
MRWYELDKARLLLEVERVSEAFPRFTLFKQEGRLVWDGKIEVAIGQIMPEPFHIRVIYESAFPVRPPSVEPITPQLDPSELGHRWHRWNDGHICIGRPRDWNIATTADEVITKAGDWYFNYMAVKAGFTEKMPDIG